MTKKMLKACVSLTTSCPKEGVNGAFWDANEHDILCVVNPYGGCFFDNDIVNDTDKQKILNACGTIESKKFYQYFEPLLDKEVYPNGWIEIIRIDDVQKLITKAKKTDDWKKYADMKVMIQRKFNSRYDIRLFVKIARCIDGQRVMVHYPAKANQPIILCGKYGMGLVLPII